VRLPRGWDEPLQALQNSEKSQQLTISSRACTPESYPSEIEHTIANDARMVKGISLKRIREQQETGEEPML
jgi:hypothetical protein